MENFQSLFFKYQLPDPLKSFYSKDYAKSNDLRLLIQIATRSFLRMHTDPKTNNIHFTCKQKGSECFDFEIHWCQERKIYYFKEDPRKMNHAGSCEQKGALFNYLEIYNLMKLKKNDIEQFMIKFDLMNQSPSAILSKLSGQKENYFFQQMINGQTELKRKLRKRFDNVINIDIKKIGKVEQKKEKQEMEQQKNISVAKTSNTKPEMQTKVAQITKKLQSQGEEQSSLKSKPKKNKIKKAPKKRLQKLKNTIQKQAQKQSNSSSEDMRQYILVLGQGNQANLETVLVNKQPNSSLAQLNLLNEQANYQWDSSSGQQQGEKIQQQNQKQPFEVIEVNRQDYFKSLRNSTLKKSLEKESLYNFIFTKQNCNN